MRRFLHTLRRLGSPACRGRRATPTARPGLEVLEGREVPTVLGISYTGPSYYQNLQVANLSSTTAISQPRPTMLANKSVTLAQPGTPANVYASLSITSLTLQADGSYAFTGCYRTSLYNVKDMQNQPAEVSVSGTLGAPQYSNFFNATCSIYIDSSSTVLFNNQIVTEHVHYTGTVTLTSSQATVTGYLYDCLEDGHGNPIIPYSCGTAPPASGTFH